MLLNAINNNSSSDDSDTSSSIKKLLSELQSGLQYGQYGGFNINSSGTQSLFSITA
jgi:hypothetical protein